MVEEEKRVKHNLSDAHVIYQLCFEFLEMQVDVADRFARGSITEEKAQHQVADTLQWMAWTLGGENPDFLPKPNWSGAPLGRHLRCVFAKDLIALEEDSGDLFKEDEAVIVYAMCRFSTDVQDLLCRFQNHDTDMAEKDARAYHDLCLKWTRILTNEPFENPKSEG